MYDVIRIVGTFIFGCLLLNFLFPTVGVLRTFKDTENENNNLFFVVGGKIGGKWYFFNGIILSLLGVVFLAICAILANWVIFLICLPYSLILYFLHWNNTCKRINSIVDNTLIATVLATVLAIFCLFTRYIYDNVTPEIGFVIAIFAFIVWLCLLFIPQKRDSNKNIVKQLLCALEDYKSRLDSPCFNKLIYNDIVTSYNKHKKEYEQNSVFKNSDNSLNYEAIKQSVISLLVSYIGNLLESGKYHLYRGILDDTGKELLKAYDFFMNEMLSLNMFDEDTKKKIDAEWIKRERNILLENIKMVG